MREKIKKIPSPLRKQIWLRILSGMIFIILFVVTWIFFNDFYVCIGLLMCGIGLITMGFKLLYDGIREAYFRVEGKCVGAEYSRVLHELKYICIETEGTVLKFPVRKIKKLFEGDRITIFLSGNTPIVPLEDGYLITYYYAMEIENKQDTQKL